MTIHHLNVTGKETFNRADRRRDGKVEGDAMGLRKLVLTGNMLIAFMRLKEEPTGQEQVLIKLWETELGLFRESMK